MISTITIVFFNIILIKSLFALQVFQLKKKVYATNNNLPISAFCLDHMGEDPIIQLPNKNYFSNQELSVLFSSAGLNEFSLVGDGVEFYKLSMLTTPQELIENTINLYPHVVPLFNLNDLPPHFAIQKSDYQKQGNKLLLSLDYVYFKGITGTPAHTLLWFECVKSPSSIELDSFILTNSVRLPNESHQITSNGAVIIESIENNSAILIYRIGGLMIKTKAHIIRQLNDTTYLVENMNSGKQIIAQKLK